MLYNILRRENSELKLAKPYKAKNIRYQGKWAEIRITIYLFVLYWFYTSLPKLIQLNKLIN